MLTVNVRSPEQMESQANAANAAKMGSANLSQGFCVQLTAACATQIWRTGMFAWYPMAPLS